MKKKLTYIALSCAILLSVTVLFINAQAPERAKIAFESGRRQADQRAEIFIMDVDGKLQEPLIEEEAGWDQHPAWSPDGERIAFTRYWDDAMSYDVCTIDANGENILNITNSPGFDQNPDWSPDGKRIAFWSNRDGNNEIYAMDADGNNQLRLTDNDAADGNPSWSPNGKKIAFVTDRDGDEEVYVMDADGNNQHNLTNNPATDGSPAWSSDGRSIAFHSTRDGNLEIYTMDANGNNQRRLTHKTVFDKNPTWFDPAGYSVSPGGKFRATWGWLKKNSK